ncbi:ImpA family metalloprotease [Vibrio sp. FNV 38]|nr:ImpA family metalloprotease [Vibrio sp. FNV 38]
MKTNKLSKISTLTLCINVGLAQSFYTLANEDVINHSTNSLQENSVKVYQDTTDTEIINAALNDIDYHQQQFRNIKKQIFNLTNQGEAKSDGSSLTDISWDPSHDSVTFKNTFGVNHSILPGNASYGNGNINNSVGIIGNSDLQRYLFLASSPQNIARRGHTVSDDFWSFYKNSIEWLVNRNEASIVQTGLNIVVSQHDESYYFKDESVVKEWLTEQYGENVTYNQASSNCNSTALSECLDDSVDLLILSSHFNSEDDLDGILTQVKRAEQLGIPLLFTNYHRGSNELSQLIFEHYSIHSSSNNYWSKTGLDSYNPTQGFNEIDQSIGNIASLLTHLRDNSFSFDIAQCTGGCSSDAYKAEFKNGVDELRTWANQLDKDRVNLFQTQAPDYQKYLIKLADYYRQHIHYPMSVDSTDTKSFLAAYYADHVVYNYRTSTPAQADLGNFSRSEFSHILPDNYGVELINNGGFKSTGAYALPGQPVTISRQDNSDDVTTKIFINTQRSGSTHEFDNNGYNRPKFLRSPSIPLYPGEQIQITSPYGGPIQVELDGEQDKPIALMFNNVGEHPRYPGYGSSNEFRAELEADNFDWAEVVTPSFEVHSTAMKMGISLTNPLLEDVKELAEFIEVYTHNYPHVLAGYQGHGIDSVPEIIDWAQQKGIPVATLTGTKHMNADRATCGSGCSGNPYDANWSFNPIGHGDIHELGHGLEKHRLRFSGFTTHSSTNPYSYYTKSQFRVNQGEYTDCQNLNNETYFEHLQTASVQANPQQYIASLGLGSNWRTGPVIYLQMMMQIQERGLLDNGWHLYPRLHIVLRQFDVAVKSDTAWAEFNERLGFSHFNREEAKALSQDDWLAIAIAYTSGLDFTEFLEMWGRTITPEAKAQINAFGLPKAESTQYYRFEGDDYCATFTHQKLAIDGDTDWNGVIIEGENVALNKPASASSTYSSTAYLPSLLNDGNAKSYFHTSRYQNKDHWLEIDLLESYTLNQLVLTNRHLHNSHSINGAVVMLLDEQRNTVWSKPDLYFESLEEVQVFSRDHSELTDKPVRFIRIEHPNGPNLALGEIEAFAAENSASSIN